MVWRGMSAALPTVLPARAQGAAARASPGVVVLRDPGPEPAKGPGAWARAPHRHVPRARRLPRASLQVLARGVRQTHLSDRRLARALQTSMLRRTAKAGLCTCVLWSAGMR